METWIPGYSVLPVYKKQVLFYMILNGFFLFFFFFKLRIFMGTAKLYTRRSEKYLPYRFINENIKPMLFKV